MVACINKQRGMRGLWSGLAKPFHANGARANRLLPLPYKALAIKRELRWLPSDSVVTGVKAITKKKKKAFCTLRYYTSSPSVGVLFAIKWSGLSVPGLHPLWDLVPVEDLNLILFCLVLSSSSTSQASRSSFGRGLAFPFLSRTPA